MINYKHTDYMQHVAANPSKGLRFYSYDGQFFKKTTSSLALQILAEDNLIAPLYLLNKQIIVATSYEEGVGYESVFINNNAIDTIQDIRTTAVPSFAGIKYNGTSGYVQLQAAGSVTSYSLTLPTVAPAANQFLLSNASGVFAWSTLSVHDPVTIAPTVADIISISGQQLYVTAGITVGNIIYYNGTKLTKLANPASTKFLRNTSGGSLSWETITTHDEVTISSTVADLFQMNVQTIERKTGLVAGDIAYYNGTKWTILGRPIATQVLQNTAAGTLSWVNQTASYWTRTGTVLTTAKAGDWVHLSSNMQKLVLGATNQTEIYHDASAGVDNLYIRMLGATSNFYVHLSTGGSYNLFNVSTSGTFSNRPLGSTASRWTAGYLSLVDSVNIYSSSTSGTDPGYQIYRESDTSAGVIIFGRKRAAGVALVNGDYMGLIGFRNDTTFTSSVSPVYIAGVYNSSGSYFEIKQFNGSTDNLVFSFNATRNIRFNDAYSFPTTIGVAGKVLKVPSSGTILEWGDAGSTALWEATQTSWLRPVSVSHKSLVIYDNATTNPTLTELSTGAEHITFLKKRSSGAVTTADSLGGLSFAGYDGTSYGPGFFIDVYPDTTWTVADHTSTMRIQRMLHSGTSSSITIGGNITLLATAMMFEDSSWQYIFPQTSGTEGQVMMKGASTSMAWTSLTTATSTADILSWNNLALGSATGLSHGDIIYYSTNKWTRLAAGTNGYVLTLSSGVPVWAASTNLWVYSGFLSPATASHPINLNAASGSYLRIANSAAYAILNVSSYPLMTLGGVNVEGYDISVTMQAYNKYSKKFIHGEGETTTHEGNSTSTLNKYIFFSMKRDAYGYSAHLSGDNIATYQYLARNAGSNGIGLYYQITASQNWATTNLGVDYILASNLNNTNSPTIRIGAYGAGYVILRNSDSSLLRIENNAGYYIGSTSSFYFPTNTQSQGAILYGNSTTDTKWLTKGTAGQILAMGASNIPEWITASGGTPYTAGDGIDIDGSNVVSVDYNTTNLKITATEIDTIQSIAEAASPLFANLKLTGYLELRDGQGTPNYVRFAAPSTVSTSYTITLPAAPPNTGNYLQYNGTNYVWAAGGGGVTYTFNDPLDEVAGVVNLLYDTTNLQVNGSNQLDTIQDIATTSSPEFANVTLTTAAKLKATGAYYISLKAHASTAANYDIVFPSAAPGANTYLKYDGTNYSWSAVSVSGYTFNYPLIYTSGTNEVDLLYDAVNLQINLDHELDTIQDIATTSSPTWADVTLTSSLIIEGSMGSITQYAQNTGANWSIIWPTNAPGQANSLLVSGATGDLSWRQLGIHASLSNIVSLNQQEFQAAGSITNASIIYYSTASAKWERLTAPAVAGTHYLKNTSAGAIEWVLSTGLGGLWEEYDPNNTYYNTEKYVRPISSEHTGIWLQVDANDYGSHAERASIVLAKTTNGGTIPDTLKTNLGLIIFAGHTGGTVPTDLIQIKGSVSMSSGVPTSTLEFNNTISGVIQKGVISISSLIRFYGNMSFAKPTSADDGKILIYDYASQTLQFQTYGAATLWQEYSPGVLYPGQLVQKYIKPISSQHEGLWIEADESIEYNAAELVLARSVGGGDIELTQERIGEISFVAKYDDEWSALASINGGYDGTNTFPSGRIYFNVYNKTNTTWSLELSVSYKSIRFHDSYTFPSADGTAGYALTTDGLGQLGWTNISGGGSKWTDNTTYLIPTDDRDIWTYSGRKFVSGAGYLWDSGTSNPIVLGSTKDINIESDTNVELRKSTYRLIYAGSTLSTGANNELEIGTLSSKIKNIHTTSFTLYDGTSSNIVLNASSLVSSYTLYLPDSNGTAGQILQLNSALKLEWASVSVHNAVSLNSTTQRIFSIDSSQVLKSNAYALEGEIIYLKEESGAKEWHRLASPTTPQNHYLSNTSAGNIAWTLSIWYDDNSNIQSYNSRNVKLHTTRKYIVDTTNLYQSSLQSILDNSNINTNSSVALTLSGSPSASLIWTRSALYSSEATVSIGKLGNIFSGVHVNDLKLYPGTGNGILTHTYSTSNISYTLTWPGAPPVNNDFVLTCSTSGDLTWAELTLSGGSLWEFGTINAHYYLKPIDAGHYELATYIESDSYLPTYNTFRSKAATANLTYGDIASRYNHYGRYNSNWYNFAKVEVILNGTNPESAYTAYEIYTLRYYSGDLYDVKAASIHHLGIDLFGGVIKLFSGNTEILAHTNNGLYLYLPSNNASINQLLFSTSTTETQWKGLADIIMLSFGTSAKGSILYGTGTTWDVYTPTSPAPVNGNILSWSSTLDSPEWISPPNTAMLNEIQKTLSQTINANSALEYQFTIDSGFMVDAILIYWNETSVSQDVCNISVEIYQSDGQYLGNSNTHGLAYALNLFFREDNILLQNTILTDYYVVGDHGLDVNNTNLFSKYDLIKVSNEYYRIQDVVSNTITIYDGLDTDKDTGQCVNRIYERKNLGAYYNKSTADKLYVRVENNDAYDREYTVIVKCSNID